MCCHLQQWAGKQGFQLAGEIFRTYLAIVSLIVFLTVAYLALALVWALSILVNLPSYSITHGLSNCRVLGIGISEGTQYIYLGIQILFDH